jgi:hypothetical protein
MIILDIKRFKNHNYYLKCILFYSKMNFKPLIILILTINNILVDSKSIETRIKCPEGFVGRNCSIGI